MLLQSELYALAARQGIREGLSGAELRNRVAEIVSNPEPAMVDKAAEFSKYATFNAKPGPFTQKVIGLREASILGKNFKPLQIHYSVCQYANQHFQDRLRVQPGRIRKTGKVGLSTPEASEVMAKATIGTLAMAGFASLAANGKLTGAAPTDPAEARCLLPREESSRSP